MFFLTTKYAHLESRLEMGTCWIGKPTNPCNFAKTLESRKPLKCIVDFTPADECRCRTTSSLPLLLVAWRHKRTAALLRVSNPRACTNKALSLAINCTMISCREWSCWCFNLHLACNNKNNYAKQALGQHRSPTGWRNQFRSAFIEQHCQFPRVYCDSSQGYIFIDLGREQQFVLCVHQKKIRHQTTQKCSFTSQTSHEVSVGESECPGFTEAANSECDERLHTCCHPLIRLCRILSSSLGVSTRKGSWPSSAGCETGGASTSKLF